MNRFGSLNRRRGLTSLSSSPSPRPAPQAWNSASGRRHLCSSAAALAALTPPGPEPAPASPSARRTQLQHAKPFSAFLTDSFNRQHDYLRISVTERCNLRCMYCMPAEGVTLSPAREMLTTPEIVLLASLFVAQGVTKIRLTGGEPTVRRDFVPLMQQLGALRARGLRELCITTNGIALHRKLDALVAAGLTGVNLSLDTLDPLQFQIMTRRKGFDAVQRSIDRVLAINHAHRQETGQPRLKLKINCVVMRGLNDGEILPFVELTRAHDLEVRFIEYMPFDGNRWNKAKMLSYADMLAVIRRAHPGLHAVAGHANDTSKTWQVPGHAGRLGFITSMTHNFCGSCNRLRITGDGNLKVCLFGNAEVSLRDVLRRVNSGEPIDEQALETLRRAGGLPAEASELEALAAVENELLDVVGRAVKRKKEKHAGIGELEHMKNRPMILIDRPPLSTSPFSGSQPPTIHPSSIRSPTSISQLRLFSTSRSRMDAGQDDAADSTGRNPSPAHPLAPSSTPSATQTAPALTHVSASGSAHMVSISHKVVTSRTAVAVCRVVFSSDTAPQLIAANAVKKGDVLGVARVAGIMAAKRTADLIPLCHPLALSRVTVDLQLGRRGSGDSAESSSSDDGFTAQLHTSCTGSGTEASGPAPHVLHVRVTVTCDGKTGVEMEALTAASTAALTVYDMCKAVDKAMVVEGLRVVLKEGGKSGRWEM
ncbi:hypothetical protein BROUX41_004106 [Berkeleyomyces rouxiae]|uniref:uncharacterized protein n=1 Tax=Berkeleyomyces rouxiae TaxID=2035830 RepID=UPI003B7A0B9B